MGHPSIVGRPSPIGLRMRQVLEQRGPLKSGAPGTDATPPQIVRWLLDNLHHEEAVRHMAQKLMPLWEKKGMGGTTASKTGQALNRALDALAAPSQEPGCPGSWGGPGGGGEHLIEQDVGAALLYHLAHGAIDRQDRVPQAHGAARPAAPAPPATSCSQTTFRTAHGFEKGAMGSVDATMGSSMDPLHHWIPLSKDGRGLHTGGGASQGRGAWQEPPSKVTPVVLHGVASPDSAAPCVAPRSVAPLASHPPSAPANILTSKPLSLMSRVELGALCRGRGLPLVRPLLSDCVIASSTR